MKYKILLIFFIVVNSLFSNDNFLDTIMLDQVKRVYTDANLEEPSSYIISMNFDLNRYRLNEPITMEIRIYARKGNISFTNSINPFNNYIIRVYDNYNNEVSQSDNYTIWKYRNRNELNNAKDDRIVELNEGESYSYYVDLNNWFFFNKEGRYRIELSFNPMPEISDDFSMKADTSYFVLDKAREYKQNNNNLYIENNILKATTETVDNSGIYEIMSNTLFYMKNKDWDNYFKYMHMPSMISISKRYYETYRQNYSNTYLEDFTDTGIIQKVRNLNFEQFLRQQFDNDVTIDMIRSNYGNNFLNNLEMAYKSNNIRELAIKFDILYRTALPENRKILFEEFKKYLASAYDRQLRNRFISELQNSIIQTKDAKLKEYYTSILDMIKSEYDPAVNYTLLNYKIDKITIYEEWGLPKAEIQTILYNRYFNSNTGDIFDPIIKRTFILRKMGDRWYIVNYYDSVAN